jgi:hypothetical protein
VAEMKLYFLILGYLDSLNAVFGAIGGIFGAEQGINNGMHEDPIIHAVHSHPIDFLELCPYRFCDFQIYLLLHLINSHLGFDLLRVQFWESNVLQLHLGLGY